MEFLRYFIFFYCFLGVFVCGGLFFYKRSPANIALALFILFFTFEQLDFLYTTSEVIFLYPQYFLFVYPICLLFGPTLWLHFEFIRKPDSKFKSLHLLHLLPFIVFVLVLLQPILKLEGAERIEFARANFMNRIMPLNYIRTTHVAFYGLMMLVVVFRNRLYRKNDKGVYLSIVAAIYFFTAVLQSYLTGFADSYRQFSLYFFLASTIVVVAGIVLYGYPELLQQFHQKYFSSSLKELDRKRIIEKINGLEKSTKIFADNNLNLKTFCTKIDEKPQYVSQVFSEDFSKSFSDFINENRVHIAKEILSDENQDHLKILAVAFESGFNNNVTFNKAFVKFTGTTPGKFRKGRSAAV